MISLQVPQETCHDAAYDNRYCFQHGKEEFLLVIPMRWMRLTDFKLPAAEDRLESMFEQFNIRPAAFNPHSRRHQAECTNKLWFHIESGAAPRRVRGCAAGDG